MLKLFSTKTMFIETMFIETMFIETMFKEKNLIFLQTCGYYITVCIVFPYGK